MLKKLGLIPENKYKKDKIIFKITKKKIKSAISFEKKRSFYKD